MCSLLCIVLGFGLNKQQITVQFRGIINSKEGVGMQLAWNVSPASDILAVLIFPFNIPPFLGEFFSTVTSHTILALLFVNNFRQA